MGVSVPLQRLWQGLRDTWDAEPEESPPLLRPGQLDPSPALADALQPEKDQPPQLAASGINLSCGTVGVIPAAQGVRGNSSDLCPRALLGIPAEQGLWHFTGCNELLLLHWRQKHEPAVAYYHLLVLCSTKGCYNSHSG